MVRVKKFMLILFEKILRGYRPFLRNKINFFKSYCILKFTTLVDLYKKGKFQFWDILNKSQLGCQSLAYEVEICNKKKKWTKSFVKYFELLILCYFYMKNSQSLAIFSIFEQNSFKLKVVNIFQIFYSTFLP